jgi:hypothetical protein
MPHDKALRQAQRARQNAKKHAKRAENRCKLLLSSVSLVKYMRYVVASQTAGAGPSRIQLPPPLVPQTLSQILGM